MRGTSLSVKCEECGDLYIVAQSRYYQKGIKYHYCSDECYHKFKAKQKQKRKDNKTHFCSNCGNKFEDYRHNKTDFVFCSQKCSKEFQKGENAFSFKGGSITYQGYKANKIKGKYVLEHRTIIEKSLGRKLAKDEVVHHKDGNKLNNTISNLQLMKKRDHDKLHLERIRERRKCQKIS